MKRFFYFAYAVVFHLCRILPVQNNRVCLVSPHNADLNDALGEIEQELQGRGGFQINTITHRDLHLQLRSGVKAAVQSVLRAISFFSYKAYWLATAHYVFLNDNFMPMADLHFHKKAVIVQLWHAQGAFKRFGQSLALDPATKKRLQKGNQRLTFAVCSSEAVVPIYAQALGLPNERVLPLGSAQADYFFRRHDVAAMRERLDAAYPAARGKKLVLYAPTFRDTPAEDAQILANLDAALFEQTLGAQYHLLVRLHPQVHTAALPQSVSDATAWGDVRELALLCDILVTDYSSICMEFAWLNKPCIFFAYDLAQYETQRPFYFPYEAYVPGPVVTTFSAVVDAVKAEAFAPQKRDAFRQTNFGTPQPDAAKRIVETVLQKH